jgi:hypothetical protein
MDGLMLGLLLQRFLEPILWDQPRQKTQDLLELGVMPKIKGSLTTITTSQFFTKVGRLYWILGAKKGEISGKGLTEVLIQSIKNLCLIQIFVLLMITTSLTLNASKIAMGAYWLTAKNLSQTRH